MPKLKLTDTAVRRLRAPDPSGRQVLHWDTELPGFGVLVSGSTNARTYVAQRKLPDGRTRRVTIGAVAELSLASAREEAGDVLQSLRKGNDPKAKRRAAPTLRRALDDYLSARAGLRERSRSGYRAAIETRLADWLDRPLPELTPDMVADRHRKIADDVTAAGRGTGAATANAVMRAFRAVYNLAAEADPSLPPNPCRALRRRWYDVPRRERLVRADDLPKFYAAIHALPSRTHRDYLLLLLFTGLRRTEAASLRWDDVDLAGGLIRLPGKRVKSGRALDLPLTDFVRGLLIERRGLGREESDFVFPSDSKHGYLAEPKFPLGQVALATGIRVSAHDLRRTYITVAEQTTGVSLLTLKALVNHHTGNDVTAGYAVKSVDDLRVPAQAVCDRMRTLCRVPDPAADAENVERLAAPE